MKEKPILLSTPMVQALLNTKPNTWPAEPIDPAKPYKSMTRRVVKPQPPKESRFIGFGSDPADKDTFQRAVWDNGQHLVVHKSKPRYEVGDVLWARETFSPCPEQCGGGYFYKADCFDEEVVPHKWNPSIHMPRKAARLILEVKKIRFEGVQDITFDDTKAEGIYCSPPQPECLYPVAFRRHFRKLWDHLNAKRGYPWDSNPWVWVYEFMRTA
jgi:hypothetical protein